MPHSISMQRLPERLFDGWLRFDPWVEARWEADLGQTRVADVRRAIIVGLVLYNAFNVSDLILMPDTAWWTIALRLCVATPATGALYWIVGRIGSKARERLVLLALLNAALLPVPAFVASDAEWALFAFPEFFLSVVYGNMLLALRFRHACTLTLVCLATGAGALALRADGASWLDAALAFQLAVVCAFSLFSNYAWERRRCEAYVVALEARLHRDHAEAVRRQLEDLSVTDALTGLGNRRLLDRRLADWAGQRAAVTLAMIDVDHFKAFNDTLGHPAGDDCLRDIATVLRRAADGGTAFVARFGGEEFTMALPLENEFEAVRIVRDLLRNVEALAILHPGRTDGIGVVTASAGVASRPAGTDWTSDVLIREADEALYRSKRDGRNRFSLAT